MSHHLGLLSYWHWDMRLRNYGRKASDEGRCFLLNKSMTIYTNTKPVTLNARTASTVWKNLFLGALIALFAIVGMASISLSAAPAFAQEVEVPVTPPTTDVTYECVVDSDGVLTGTANFTVTATNPIDDGIDILVVTIEKGTGQGITQGVVYGSSLGDPSMLDANGDTDLTVTVEDHDGFVRIYTNANTNNSVYEDCERPIVEPVTSYSITCAADGVTPQGTVTVTVGNQDLRVWLYNKTGGVSMDNSTGYFGNDDGGRFDFTEDDYGQTFDLDISRIVEDLAPGDEFAFRARFVSPVKVNNQWVNLADELRITETLGNPCHITLPVTTFDQSYSFDCATGPQWVVTNTGNEDRTVILQQQIGELNGTPQYATVSSTTVPAGEEVTLDFADAVPAEDTTETFVINTFSANSAPTYITQDVSVDCEYAYPSIEISPDCGGLEIMQFANAGTADMLVEMIVNGEVVDSFTMASMDFREYSIAPYLVEDVEVTLEYRVTSLDTVIQDVVFSGLRDCEEPVCEFDSSLVASDKDCVEETLITDENEEDTTPEPEEEKEESEEDTPEEEVIPEPEEENTDEEEVIEEINTTDGAEEEAPVEEEDESELALTGGFHKQMIAYAGVFLATGFLLFLIGRRKREDDIVLWSHSGSIRVN